MKSIISQLNERGWAIKPCQGTFGIEIETEVKHKNNYPPGFLTEIPMVSQNHMWDFRDLPEWKGHVDHSLRNFGIEYVLREPLLFDDTVKALENFGEKTQKIKFIEDAPGTSVHIHMNVGKYDFRSLGNFLTAYSLYENILAYFAKRPSNLFALPIRCAEENHSVMVNIFSGVERGDHSPFCDLDPQMFKYAALNLCPLLHLGSVESRLLRGTTNASEIINWVTILKELLAFSIQPGLTPDVLMSELRVRGKDLMFEIFPDTHDLLSIEHYDYLVSDRQIFYAGYLSASVNNWNSLEFPATKKENPRKKKADIHGQSYSQYLINNGIVAHTEASQTPMWDVHEPVEDDIMLLEEDD